MDALTFDELLALLGAARAGRTRDWLMLLVAFWHGLRVSEVIQIKAEDVRDNSLDVRRLKGSRHTIQSLFDHENDLLSERKHLFEYCRGMAGNQRLFPISRRQADRLIKRYAMAAGIAEHKAHMHVLKHSCGRYLRDRISLPHLQRHLGHVSLKNTGIYLEVTDDEASAAVQRALKA